MNSLRTHAFARIIPLLFCTLCVSKPNQEANNHTSTAEHYTVEDFTSIEKFDSHIHLNTDQTAFIEQAEEDNLRFLVIVDDRPFGITMEDQQKIVRKQLKAYPERIAYATTFPVKDFTTDNFVEQTISYLDDSFAYGAIAVKVWKNIGMDLRDQHGNFVMIDDPKFDAIFDHLERKGITLIGHLGEPRECWLPLEKMKLHKGYYSAHPEYHMYLHPEYPSYEDQISARDHMLEKHPNLKFIGAHLGSLEWNLDELAKRLDKFPNMAVDLARFTDLYYHAMVDWQKTHDFFIRYQDRLLYATDVQVRETDSPEEMNAQAHDTRIQYWKFFTTDETFRHPAIDGSYKGLKLPSEVVDRIYRTNAEKWLAGIPGK